MIAVLIHGRVLTEPRVSNGANNRPFTTLRMRVHADTEAITAAIVGFDAVGEQMAALSIGDLASIAGTVTVASDASADSRVLRIAATRLLPLNAEVVVRRTNEESKA